MEEKEIINRVANSPLITLDLEAYFHQGDRLVFDLKDWLFQGMILKEKDFRESIKNHDWSQYKDKNIAITCSEDAIIPTWAFMLIAVSLSPYAHFFIFGSLESLEMALFNEALSKINVNEFSDQKVIIKGCGKFPVPESAYVEITRLLSPIVASLMFGEACSTVPLYKRKKP